MQFQSRFMIVLLLSILAFSAFAADPQPPVQSLPRVNSEVAPQLDINQAEFEAGVVPEIVDPVMSPQSGPNVSPMMAEINATLEASQAQVAELSARAAGNPDHSGNLAIQIEISELKQQAELDILAIQSRYARAAGNQELAQQIDDAIAAILSPPAPTAPTTPRPAPESQR